MLTSSTGFEERAGCCVLAKFPYHAIVVSKVQKGVAVIEKLGECKNFHLQKILLTCSFSVLIKLRPGKETRQSQRCGRRPEKFILYIGVLD